MNKQRKNCPMRHVNGNCLSVGGFCTAVSDNICEALHNAYECGKYQICANELWVDVSKRKPDDELAAMRKCDANALYPCLTVVKHELASGGRYVAKSWYGPNGFIDGDGTNIDWDITHWMPLPKPPEI